MLENSFHKETFIYADNIDSSDAKIFKDFIFNNSEKYTHRFLHQEKAILINLR